MDKSTDNNIIRSSCVINSSLDILGIAETHLLSNNILTLDGYTWFGYNRQIIHKMLEPGQVGLVSL